MKVYLLFKVKDMSKRNKEWIVDNIYTTFEGACRREAKLHKVKLNFEMAGIRNEFETVAKSRNQQTYIIQKSVRGQITLPLKRVRVRLQDGITKRISNIGVKLIDPST